MRVHDGQVWRCCQPHDNKNNPDIEPGNLRRNGSHITPQTPKRKNRSFSPRWREDSYQKGEVCLWTDGKVYRSTMETANAYSPPQTIRRMGSDMEVRTPRRGPVPRRGHSITGRNVTIAELLSGGGGIVGLLPVLLTLVQIAPIRSIRGRRSERPSGGRSTGTIEKLEETREPF